MNANAFPDSRRGRVGPNDLARVGEYSASTLPRGGPGTTSRRFPSGTVVTPLPTRRAKAATGPTQFKIVPASSSMNPGRVRVVNGRLNGMLPAEMNLLDVLLPDGTDNHCYLSMASGTNYIYGKLPVDGDGIPTAPHVYTQTAEDAANGDYVFLLLGVVGYDGATVSIISQDVLGNQSTLIYSSADGNYLYPDWGGASE